MRFGYTHFRHDIVQFSEENYFLFKEMHGYLSLCAYDVFQLSFVQIQ